MRSIHRWSRPNLAAVVAVNLLPCAAVCAQAPDEEKLLPGEAGSDIAHRSPWLTKFAWAHDVDNCTNLSTSLRVYWGFPGVREQAMYNGTLPPPRGAVSSSVPGHDQAFEASVLGWADIDLNKRNYVHRNRDYRSEAAAVGVSATAN